MQSKSHVEFYSKTENIADKKTDWICLHMMKCKFWLMVDQGSPIKVDQGMPLRVQRERLCRWLHTKPGWK